MEYKKSALLKCGFFCILNYGTEIGMSAFRKRGISIHDETEK